MKNVLLAFLALVGVIGVYYVTLHPGNSLRLINPNRLTPTAIPNTSNTTILLTPNGFVPASLTIKKDDTVIWKNESGKDAQIDSDPHPVHTSYPPLNLGDFKNGSQLSLKFDKSGTYQFHNHLNPIEKGTIEVR